MKSLKKKWNLHKKELLKGILLVGGILGAIGSYQYYSAKVEGFRLFSAVVYSTIKLFVFSPTIWIGPEAPLIYEIAKWIAPVGTVLGFFTVFGDVFYTVRNTLTGFGKRTVIVVGSGYNAITFLQNLLTDRHYKGILLSEKPIEKTDEELLKKRGGKVVLIDFHKDSAEFIAEKLKGVAPDKAENILFLDDELENFSRMKKVLSFMKKKSEPIHMIMTYSTPALKEMMQEEADQDPNWDIRFIKPEEVIVEDILERGFSFVPREPKKITDLSLSGLSQEVGTIHIVIMGFSTIGQSLFLEGLNRGVSNLTEKIHYTIVDRCGEEKFQEFASSYRFLDRMAEVKIISRDINDPSVADILEERHRELPITSLCYCIRDGKASLVSLHRLCPLLKDVDVAFRTEDIHGISPFIRSMKDRVKSIVLFGSPEQILTRKNMIDDDVVQRARRFNFEYGEILEQLVGYPQAGTPEEQWSRLSVLKKESTLKQISHRATKQELIRHFISSGLLDGSLESVLEQWTEKLEGKTIAEQVAIIEDDPVMNYLSAIEHRRWCNFHYLRNFELAPVKDEERLKHDCLIYDWDEFLASPQRDKAIYDFLAVLNIV